MTTTTYFRIKRQHHNTIDEGNILANWSWKEERKEKTIEKYTQFRMLKNYFQQLVIG